MPKIQSVKFKNFEWINIDNPTEKEINYLHTNFKFHPLDLQYCLDYSTRTKIDIYPDYSFLVIIFPVYDRESKSIKPGVLNFFISRQFIISLNRRDLTAFTDFFSLFTLNPDLKDKYKDGSPERLLYEILNKLLHYCFPMLDHIIEDCDKIENAIFSSREQQLISQILAIRRNVTDFRKVSQVHKNFLKRLINNLKESPLYVMKKTDLYYENLVDYTKEIWDTLENLKERIEALQETNESQISFKLSDIMKALTIISVITFPITLIAAIFGMNTVQAMPFVNHPKGFWLVIVIMLGIVSTMLTIFKRKRWL